MSGMQVCTVLENLAQQSQMNYYLEISHYDSIYNIHKMLKGYKNGFLILRFACFVVCYHVTEIKHQFKR